MSGQLCLKWNNHNAAFNKLLDQIFLEDSYSDATILCQGKFYPVHRFVLSTCSEYFEEMFRQCVRLNNKHPFIIVKDIHPDQMEALLNYMYKGEVNVPQEMLPELIKAAEAFKIKGLAVPDETPTGTSKVSRKRSLPTTSPPSVPKKSRTYSEKSSISSKGESIEKSPTNNWVDSSSNKSVPSTSIESKSEEIYITEPSLPKIKPEPVDEPEPTPDPSDIPESSEAPMKPEQDFETFSGEESNYGAFEYDSLQDNDYDESGTQENFEGHEQESASWDNSQSIDGEDDPTNRMLSDMKDDARDYPFPFQMLSDMKDDDRDCPYPGCNFTSKTKGYMKTHFKIHTGEKPYHCNLCDFKTHLKTSLAHHVKSVHESNKQFLCSMCDYKSTRKGNVVEHFKSIHDNSKPFSCDLCDYKANKKHHVARHYLRIHKTKKLYTCFTCDFSTAQIGKLKLHVASKHTARP